MRTTIIRTIMLAGALASLTLPAASASAAASTVTEVPIPTANSHPIGIASGPDGALWFTEGNNNAIGRVTTAGTVTNEFAIPTATSHPVTIASGPDGAMWFTEYSGNKIGRITTTGTITEYAIPIANSGPTGVASGPDGALWFTEYNVSQIGRITTTGTITEYPTTAPNSGPSRITSGPDGALWFTEERANQIGRITTAGAVSEFPIPTPSTAPPTTFPRGITSGPDGALWFTENRTNQIGRITTAGAVTEYPIPTANSGPYEITRGPDNALWFTENGHCTTVGCTPPTVSQVGRITTTGTITEFPTPTADTHPAGIAFGPDSALWLTEFTAGNLGRVSASKRSTSATLGCSPVRVRIGTLSNCTFHVSDVGTETRTAPTGAVSFSSATPGGTFGSAASCVLIAVGADGASCQIAYTPRKGGAARITASYAGDPQHLPATATTTLTVTVPPSVTRVSQSRARWALGKKLVRFTAARTSVGTRYSFTLNERAKIRFTFTQQQRGRKVKGKCVAQTNKNLGKRICSRLVIRGVLSFTGRPGKHKVFFDGRITRFHTLKPGKYTLIITATNAAHQRSKPRKLTFTIVK